MCLQIKHWDVEDDDDEIKDQDDILASPQFVHKKRRIADALHRMVLSKARKLHVQKNVKISMPKKHLK